jgi:uncharacterized membrane protein
MTPQALQGDRTAIDHRLAAPAWRRANLVLWGALILLCLGWELWWAPLRPGGSWLALKVLPLLAAAPGMWRGKLYTYQWMSMLVWFYLTEGVVRGLTDPQSLSRTLGWLECALALAAFGMMAATLRAHASRPRMQAQPAAPDETRTAMPAEAQAQRPTDASSAAAPSASSGPRP